MTRTTIFTTVILVALFLRSANVAAASSQD
jgi:hypothetical protein